MLECALTPRTRILMLNFPTNPTGAVLSRDDAAAIARFAVEHDLLVISDEIYTELTYEQERVSVVTQPGMRERTVFLHGFSKAWAMTGFRIGYACAPAELIEAMMKIHQYTMMCAPVLSQRAAVEALGAGGPDVDEMRNQYRQRRNVMCKELTAMGLTCPRPAGAFYAFPDIRSTGLSSHDFAVGLLEAENVACVPGSAFGSAGEGFVRCCYATDIDLIREALARMARFVQQTRH
jgi:aminotransferase